MQLTKPKVEAARVTITDPESGKSRCLTLYGITRDQLFTRLESEAKQPPRKSREAVPA